MGMKETEEMKPMTPDTYRAMEAISGIAGIIGISELYADDKLLYIDDKAIGISGNSTYATVMEFIGYCMIKYDRDFRDISLTGKQEETIARYWFTDDQLAKIKGDSEGVTLPEQMQ